MFHYLHYKIYPTPDLCNAAEFEVKIIIEQYEGSSDLIIAGREL